MKYPEIEITKDDLRKIVYFILMKFKGDPLHRQGTSAKRDLIGGYIERWFNKIAETVIFEKLLEDNKYKVISDYFIYANDSDKNAPDILGLQTSDGKTIPFVKYNNGTWTNIDGMPRIEVKVVRKDQALLGVREPQMIDDYYAFIESDLEGDYLTSLFEEETFADKYFEELKMSDEFIESDKDKQIIPHSTVSKTAKVGTMRLIGIYTKGEVQNNFTLCKKDVSPYYFAGAENKDPRGANLKEKMVLDGNNRFTYTYDKGYVCLPFAIESENKTEITILKKNKGSLYIHSTDDIRISGIPVQKGNIVINLNKFDRSSKWNENIALKYTLEKFGNDSTQDLVDLFDKISTN
ncbi:MAG: hypothetical protein QY304_00680 [Candidatus Paceibacterota bacterium]|nr:MAG: hypothetical protein QY304_00680 [Candidatus Paceibacterota bacterium]